MTTQRASETEQATVEQQRLRDELDAIAEQERILRKKATAIRAMLRGAMRLERIATMEGKKEVAS